MGRFHRFSCGCPDPKTENVFVSFITGENGWYHGIALTKMDFCLALRSACTIFAGRNHQMPKYYMNVKQSMREILEVESKAVLNIPVTDAYEEAVTLIVEQVKHEGGKLVTSGMGKCGQIADNIATTFSSTGIPAIFLHPSEAQHGDLGVVQPHDVLLLLSNSGRTNEICALVDLAHNLYPQLKIVVITGNKDSKLAQLADICLWTGNTREVCPLGLTPTTSTTVMTVIGDILVVNTMIATGFTKEDYALRHHGGYLGSIAKGTKY